jgi:4-amino-4-deoxy-L-arabinose transferase-like glycosyltransferase
MIAPGVPPDEPTHIGIIGLYAEAPFFIHDTPESHPLGLVTRVPFLYHFLLGKLTTLNVFGLSKILFLRLINVAMSMTIVIVAYRLAVRVTGSFPVRILFLVMVTNTLMHTFISSVVSYDNLVNLLAVTGIFSLIAFFQSDRPLHLLAFFVTMPLGVLTKLSFLPASRPVFGSTGATCSSTEEWIRLANRC